MTPEETPMTDTTSADDPRVSELTACLFCEPGHKILCESERFFARLDVFPANPGHVEIVPRRHVVSFFDLGADEVAEAYTLMRKARRLLVAELGCEPDAWTIGVNDGRAAGRSVDHLHIHLIPRYVGDVPDPRGGIRQCAPNCTPDQWADASTMTKETSR